MVTRLLLAAVGLAALCGCGEQGEKAFGDSFDKSFRSSCIESASRPGVPGDLAAKLCDCALGEINSKFSAMEKMGLSNDELDPIVSQCAARVVPK